ncbi:MAG: hypothetical protein AAF218_09345 [Pseudomonadota bacterium]
MYETSKIEAADDARVMKAQAALWVLSEILEDCGYNMAGDVDRAQVARVLTLSQEVSQLAERLRPADL